MKNFEAEVGSGQFYFDYSATNIFCIRKMTMKI